MLFHVRCAKLPSQLRPGTAMILAFTINIGLNDERQGLPGGWAIGVPFKSQQHTIKRHPLA